MVIITEKYYTNMTNTSYSLVYASLSIFVEFIVVVVNIHLGGLLGISAD